PSRLSQCRLQSAFPWGARLATVSDDLAFTPALEQAALVRAGELSPLELVDLYLERIERIDPQLNAYVTVDADGARTAARALAQGPFTAVPLPPTDLPAPPLPA